MVRVIFSHGPTCSVAHPSIDGLTGACPSSPIDNRGVAVDVVEPDAAVDVVEPDVAVDVVKFDAAVDVAELDAAAGAALAAFFAFLLNTFTNPSSLSGFWSGASGSVP